MNDRQVFNALVQRDFLFLLKLVFETLHPGQPTEWNWHIEAMAYQLERLRQGQNRRQLINMPPRHMKSLCTSVAWPAFLIGHDPSLRVFLISYGQELSASNLRNLRLVLESDWYRSAFPQVELSSATQGELFTTAKGSVRALSTSGIGTGLGAEYLIYDDPIKQSEARSPTERKKVLDFYHGTVLTRETDPRTSRIVVVMQRVHEEDLAGALLTTGEYEVLCLPAIAEQSSTHQLYHGGEQLRRPGDLLWPERFTPTEIERLRREMPEYEFSLQYQQKAIPESGGLVRIDDLQRHGQSPDRDRCTMVVQSIDPAMTDEPHSDFSVIETFGYHDGAWRLLDVQRRRMRYPDLLDFVRAQRTLWRPDEIVVETVGGGIPLYQDLSRERSELRPYGEPTWTLYPYRPATGKRERMAAQTARLREGLVTFPQEAPWLDAFLRELAGFPGLTHDDQVDALAQFIDWAVWFRRDPANPSARPRGRPRALDRLRR